MSFDTWITFSIYNFRRQTVNALYLSGDSKNISKFHKIYNIFLKLFTLHVNFTHCTFLFNLDFLYPDMLQSRGGQKVRKNFQPGLL